jgi:large subunit ribosomal protein L18
MSRWRVSMDISEQRRNARAARRARVRKKVRGTDARPRLSVFRSNKYLYAQVISDETGRTLAAGNTMKAGGAGVTVEKAKRLGAEIAAKCKAIGVNQVVFDRAGYRYHGRIEALAEAAREAGLRI